MFKHIFYFKDFNNMNRFTFMTLFLFLYYSHVFSAFKCDCNFLEMIGNDLFINESV